MFPPRWVKTILVPPAVNEYCVKYRLSLWGSWESWTMRWPVSGSIPRPGEVGSGRSGEGGGGGRGFLREGAGETGRGEGGENKR